MSNSGSLVSSLTDETTHVQESNSINFTFKWVYGGNEVFVIGSFNNWKERLRMDKRQNEFILEKELEKGTVCEYKFIVDNDWRFAHDQLTKKDQHGNINNWIDTANIPETQKTVEEHKLADMYSQDLCSDLTSIEPDPLPAHLHHVLANHSNDYDYRNKDTVPYGSTITQTNAQLAGEDALSFEELPMPSHVILNHMGLRVKDRVLGLTISQRYRDKIFTVIYYKPYR